jgi:hypothetical protein
MFHTSRELPVRRPLRLSILAILEEGLQGIVLLLGVLAVIVVARSSGTMTIEGYPIMSLPQSCPHFPMWPPEFSCDCNAFVTYFPLIVTGL